MGIEHGKFQGRSYKSRSFSFPIDIFHAIKFFNIAPIVFGKINSLRNFDIGFCHGFASIGHHGNDQFAALFA